MESLLPAKALLLLVSAVAVMTSFFLVSGEEEVVTESLPSLPIHLLSPLHAPAPAPHAGGHHRHRHHHVMPGGAPSPHVNPHPLPHPPAVAPIPSPHHRHHHHHHAKAPHSPPYPAPAVPPSHAPPPPPVHPKPHPISPPPPPVHPKPHPISPPPTYHAPPPPPPVHPKPHPISPPPTYHTPPPLPPVHPRPHPILPPRSFFAAQGVVYCKPCKYAGVGTLLNAVPLPGAVVELRCNNSRYKPVEASAVTDAHGYFYVDAPKTVTSYAVHRCRVFLVSAPPKSDCAKVTDLHGGLQGALLIRLEKPRFTAKPTNRLLYSVGPFAAEPATCPR